MPIFDSMSWCGQSSEVLHGFLEQLASMLKSGILWRGEVEDAFKQYLKPYSTHDKKSIKGTLGQKVSHIHEAIVTNEKIIFSMRPIVGIREAVAVYRDQDRIETVENEHYLAMCETVATGAPSKEQFSFTIDFSPFRIFNPDKPDPALIGKGIDRLSHIFVSKIHENPHWSLNQFINYISHRKVNGEPLLFNSQMDLVKLNSALEKAINLCKNLKDEKSLETLNTELSLLGFAKGWGANSELMLESFETLDRVMHDPNPDDFNNLLKRLPLVQNVLLVSVHGWFAQSGVLGRPDTGGQIVYILNQARALEKYLKKLWLNAGLDEMPKVLILSRLIPENDGTTVNEPREKVHGTENTYIIRIPFRRPDGEVVKRWISRFKVWPYLNQYTKDAYHELMLEFGGSPDLIIGNYTDGNFVATALGREWGATTGIIDHALEKNKYRFSDIGWKGLENDYHFSVHYLNDMLSANSADFIITSTYQEIAGTHDETGQYESYGVFTLPQNYRVRSGIDIYTPQFVINPPGYNPAICFSYTDKSRRDPKLTKDVEKMCFEKESINGSVGYLEDLSKPPIFSMARLDKIKNIAGLVKIFAQNKELRERANLIIVGGVTEEKQSNDLEEKNQIRTIHKLIKKYNLNGQIRWLPGETNAARAAEFYRVMADHEGVFVQPALYEAFGLTVIEAMSCGLPVVATRYGGPSESIEDGVSGLLINPHKGAEVARAILRLITPDHGGTKLWKRMSEDAIKRANDKFSWERHVGKLVDASALYGFWGQLFRRDKEVTLNYIDALHYLLLLPRINDGVEVV